MKDKVLVSGSFTDSKGKETIFLNTPWQSDDVKLGRWTYCRYCYKDVLPALSSLSDWQVVCTECGAGLTPYFDTAEELQKYWDGDEEFLKRYYAEQDEWNKKQKAKGEEFKRKYETIRPDGSVEYYSKMRTERLKDE